MTKFGPLPRVLAQVHHGFLNEASMMGCSAKVSLANSTWPPAYKPTPLALGFKPHHLADPPVFGPLDAVPSGILACILGCILGC